MRHIITTLLFILCTTCQAQETWKAHFDGGAITLSFDNDKTLTLIRRDHANNATSAEKLKYKRTTKDNEQVLTITQSTWAEQDWHMKIDGDRMTVVAQPDTIVFKRCKAPKTSTGHYVLPKATISKMKTQSGFVNTTNWMSALDDRLPLAQVTLPGVHDAGTGSVKVESVDARCQMSRIDDMLKEGIRLFDMRLAKDGLIAHGFAKTEYTIEDLFRWCKEFLEGEGKGETIVLLIGYATSDDNWRNEDGTISAFTQRVIDAINTLPKDMVADFNSQSMGEVRGKVVLIHRQEQCPIGPRMDIADNTRQCAADVAGTRFFIEDMYEPRDARGKWGAALANMLQATKAKANEGHITFLSAATNCISNPWLFAWKRKYPEWTYAGKSMPMNPLFLHFLKTNKEDHTPLGWIFLDFYDGKGNEQTLLNTLISRNYLR